MLNTADTDLFIDNPTSFIHTSSEYSVADPEGAQPALSPPPRSGSQKQKKTIFRPK